MPKPKTFLMTQKAYAEKIGVTPQYVNKLVQQGKIAKIGRMIDAHQADQAIRTFRRAGRTIMPERRSHRSVTPRAAKPRAPRGETITGWRIESEKYKASMAKLDYEKTIGTLLERSEVVRAEQVKNEHFRAALSALPRSLAPALARLTSAAEIESFLREEFDRLRARLALDPLGIREEENSLSSAPAPVLPTLQTPAPQEAGL